MIFFPFFSSPKGSDLLTFFFFPFAQLSFSNGGREERERKQCSAHSACFSFFFIRLKCWYFSINADYYFAHHLSLSSSWMSTMQKMRTTINENSFQSARKSIQTGKVGAFLSLSLVLAKEKNSFSFIQLNRREGRARILTKIMVRLFAVRTRKKQWRERASLISLRFTFPRFSNRIQRRRMEEGWIQSNI